MPCERGWLDVAITLAPTMPPQVQFMRVESVLPPGEEMTKTVETTLRLMNEWDAKQAASLVAPGLEVERMRSQLASASQWGMCKTPEAVAGDGTRDSVVKLSCERGTLLVRLSLEPTTRRLTSFNLVPSRDQRCVP